MKLIDIAVLAVVAAAVIGVLIVMLRRRKKRGRGDFCAGGCQGCPYAPDDRVTPCRERPPCRSAGKR